MSSEEPVCSAEHLTDTHALLDLVPDGLQDAGAVALTQLLGGPQVVARRLHLLLLKRHHGVLQRDRVKGHVTVCERNI